MIKILLGAAIVVGLVGYGIITPAHIDEAGTHLKNGINTYIVKPLDEATKN